MLIELGLNINYQKAFLKAFFFDNIFSLYEKNHLEFNVVSEDIIIKNENIYYFSMLNGPLGMLGTFVAVKDNNLIFISIYERFTCVKNQDLIKKDLETSLIDYFEGFHCEKLFEDQNIDELKKRI